MPVKSCGYVINSRKLLRPGQGSTTPTEGSVCQVVIHEVSGDGSSPSANSHCATGELQITIGAAENDFDDTIERCLETMTPGEMCEIRIRLDEPVEPGKVAHQSHRRASDPTGSETREMSVSENEYTSNGKPSAQSDEGRYKSYTNCNVVTRDSVTEETNTVGEDVKMGVNVIPDLDSECVVTQIPKVVSEESPGVRDTTQPETTADRVVQGDHRGAVETENVGIGVDGDPRDYVLRVSLLDVTQASDVWRLSAQEKLERAQRYKSVGAQLYRQGSTEWAFRKFSRALKYLLLIIDDDGLSAEMLVLGRELRCQCYMNLAACQLKHANSTGVVANCTKGLALEPNNLKGLFRRAQAYVMRNEHDAACDDLQAALAIEPSNGAVQRLLRKVKVTVQKENALMAAAYAKLASGAF